jgi:ribosomal protein L29
MKTKELEKLKSKNQEELKEDLKNYQDRLWQLLVDLRSGKVKNVREIRQIKKVIAVINTLLTK